MTHSVALIGTSHPYQFGGSACSPSQTSAFAALLRRTCLHYAAAALAEEMSLSALQRQERSESTVATIARELGLSHAYCDPTEEQQAKMGLQVEKNAIGLSHFSGWTQEQIARGVAKEHRLREQFWADRLDELNVWPVVFVCGSEPILLL